MKLDIQHGIDNTATFDWQFGSRSGQSSVIYSVTHDDEGLATCYATSQSGDTPDSEVLEAVLRECEIRHNRPVAV